MQYTIRNIPGPLDRALRARARAQHKSLNTAALDALRTGLGLDAPPTQYRDLSDIAGSWVEDPEFDKALEDIRRVNPEDWR